MAIRRTFKALTLSSALLLGLCGAQAGRAETLPELPQYCKFVPPPSQSLPGATSFTYGTLADRALRIHVFSPPNDGQRRPAALFFFGGGFRIGDVSSYVELAKAFVAQGYVAALADYRVLCRDRVTPAAGVEDAEAAHRWLLDHAAELGVDPKRIVVVGGSAGGQLAAAAALREPPRIRPAALVLFNPVTDLTVGPWAQGMTPAEVSAYSASALPIAGLPPTIIFHGTADTTVPIKTARDFCDRAVAANRTCKLVEYEGVGHSFADKREMVPSLGLIPFDDTTAKTFGFLDSVLKPPPRR